MNISAQPSPVVIVLAQTSLALARQISAYLPGTKIYGLSTRVTGADINYEQFATTVQDLFTTGTPIIGICAAGILIRTLAPLLNNKYLEPPVIAVAEDGSAVVPLLGGLQGVNDLARTIATGLKIPPAITTTGEIRFQTTLLNPPSGYILANPDDAKNFIANLIAGEKLKVIGDAPWLFASKLPIAEDGNLTIKITENITKSAPNCLVYYPQKLILIIATNQVEYSSHQPRDSNPNPETLYQLIEQTLQTANLAPQAIAAVFCPQLDVLNANVSEIADKLNRPLRLFNHDSIHQDSRQSNLQFTNNAIANTTAIINTIPDLSPKNTIAIASTPEFACIVAISTKVIHPEEYGQPRGKLTVIGTGPGNQANMSPQAKAALTNATDLVGYTTYLNLVGVLPGQTRHDSDNREELARAKFALDLAASGKIVAVVSSGDPGIYAMAAAIFEVIDRANQPEWATIEIEITPGISAVQAAAAKVGAPIGHDFCLISLSDILKPWSIIETRIQAALTADFVIAFYNPVSKTRTWQLQQAKEIILRHRHPDTPVILGKNLTRPGEEIIIQTLADLNVEQVDMRTVIIIGSSRTKIISRYDQQGVWVYTPRWYE